MTCGIYKITSPSDRIYIGQSRNIERRWTKYFSLDCKTQIKLNRSFEKYGVTSHTFEIIEECEFEELNNRERYWQDFYKCMDGGLNCVLTNTEEKPKILSIETRQKMSCAHKGRKASKETLLKMSINNLGKVISEETRQKISLANSGKRHTLEVRLRMSENSKKKVIDTLTNKIYGSAKEASEGININYSTLMNMLSGHRKNKTSLIYYNEGKPQKSQD